MGGLKMLRIGKLTEGRARGSAVVLDSGDLHLLLCYRYDAGYSVHYGSQYLLSTHHTDTGVVICIITRSVEVLEKRRGKRKHATKLSGREALQPPADAT